MPAVSIGFHPVDYQHKCPISYQEAESWATLNAKTFFDNGDANNNTWFRVPSVTVRNGSAEIRTVAYSNKGGSIERSGTAFNTKYYCENAPSTSDMVYAPGELFLGTYGYSWNTSMANGEERKQECMACHSIPDRHPSRLIIPTYHTMRLTVLR